MIAATSWFLTTLAGLGLVLTVALGDTEARRRWRDGQERVLLIALALTTGLLTDHTAGIITGSLRFQAGLAWVGGVGAIAVLMFLARAPMPARPPWTAYLAVGLILLLALAVYAEPLLEWDARSIWFFHAKAIFFDGGLKASPFWNNPAYDWSHKDYPELLPMLAARYAAFTGAWNEFAPKGALVPLAAAGFLGLLAAAPAAFPVLAPAAVILLGASLWNGYMDGWIAVYGAVAALSAAAWMENGRRPHLILCAAALGIALCLKNEGQLLALAMLPAILWAARRRRPGWLDLSALIAFVPFVLWLVVKAKLGLHGGLEGVGLAHRALVVAGDSHELLYRLSYLAKDAFARTHLFGAVGAWLAVGLCMGFSLPARVCGVSAALYGGGLIMVYLGTPFDFAWHVGTSLDRVLLAPTLFFLCGVSTMIPDVLSAMRKAASPVS